MLKRESRLILYFILHMFLMMNKKNKHILIRFANLISKSVKCLLFKISANVSP